MHLCCGLTMKCPIGSCVGTRGPQLVVLFERVIEPFGGRALLEEVLVEDDL